MDYQEMLKVAEETIREMMISHKKYPSNGYLDSALGVHRMFYNCALKLKVSFKTLDKDNAILISIFSDES